MGIEKLDQNEKIKLILDNNERWKLMKTKIVDLYTFLSNGELTDNNFSMAVSSLNLILSELYINQKEYDEFPPISYNFDDFAHLIFEYKVEPEDFISKKDDEVNRSIQKLREKVWGYAKNEHQNLIDFFIDLVELKNDEKKIALLVEQNQFLLVACSLIVFVECILREQERKILEKTYQ